MARRGKAIASTASFLALAVLAGTAFAARDWIREEYWLWQLESDTEATRELAAGRLGEMKSARAVPGLVNAIRQGYIGEDGKNRKHVYRASLLRMGALAAPGWVEMLLDGRMATCDRWCAAWELAGLGPEIPESLPAFEKAARDPNPSIRKVADLALKRLHGDGNRNRTP